MYEPVTVLGEILIFATSVVTSSTEAAPFFPFPPRPRFFFDIGKMINQIKLWLVKTIFPRKKPQRGEMRPGLKALRITWETSPHLSQFAVARGLLTRALTVQPFHSLGAHNARKEIAFTSGSRVMCRCSNVPFTAHMEAMSCVTNTTQNNKWFFHPRGAAMWNKTWMCNLAFLNHRRIVDNNGKFDSLLPRALLVR